MSHRDWEGMQNDEIYAIWYRYLESDGFAYSDPLHLSQCAAHAKPLRLTMMEIIRLVNELLDRLEAKDGKEVDSGSNQKTRRSS